MCWTFLRFIILCLTGLCVCQPYIWTHIPCPIGSLDTWRTCQTEHPPETPSCNGRNNRMSESGPRYYPCVWCRKRTKPLNRRFLTGLPEYVVYLHNYLDINVDNDKLDSLCTCTACYMKFYRQRQSIRTTTTTYTDNFTEDDCDTTPSTGVRADTTSEEETYIPVSKKPKVMFSPQTIQLSILSSGNSHSTCCVCKKRGSKLITVPTECRYRLFVEKYHLLLAGSRCCPVHITDKYFNTDSLGRFQDNNTSNTATSASATYFNRTGICTLISNIREIALRNEQHRIDFDTVAGLDESDYMTLTGFSKTDFDDICSHLTTGSIRSTKNRTSRTAVALLLVKLRTAMSNKLLSTLFNIGKSSVRRSIVSARTALTADFTPKYVGFEHVSRDDVIKNHTRPLAQELFGDMCATKAILVVDGTYIFIEKSNNFKFQRRSYSMHKNRPLVKPMVIVTTTGYIVSILGPYHADSKNNDASILKHNILCNMENMKEWLQPEDVLVVDRGFRDSIDFLSELGIETKMPAFLKKGQKQHTTEEANSSRLVTKIRWIVESVNGRLKQWKYLQNIVPNNQIPFIGDYVRLIAALCNRYRAPLNTGTTEADQLIAAKMKVLAAKTNELQQRVQEEQLDRRTHSWEALDADNALPDFPSLSEEELRNITIGIYQLKLAKSYTCEHLSEDGDYTIMVNGDVPGILRARIQSRHTSAKSYLLWIGYSPAIVTSWFCQCKAGARVVGTCAHITAVLWYLGYARHLGTVKGVKDWSMFLEDAANVPEIMDDSESDDSGPEE